MPPVFRIALAGLAGALTLAGVAPRDGAAAAAVPAQSRAAAPLPAFEDALAVAADLPRLHSLIVSRRGAILLERYYNGARATRPANVKSAAKSVISALVGIAIHSAQSVLITLLVLTLVL